MPKTDTSAKPPIGPRELPPQGAKVRRRCHACHAVNEPGAKIKCRRLAVNEGVNSVL
jgi:cytochrome c2